MNLSAKLILSIACILVSSQASAIAEKVYKWTDEKGQTHYSQHPPFNTQTEVLKTQTGHSDPVDYKATSETKDKVEAKAESNTAPPKDKERCENARQNIEALKTHARIRIKGDNGEYRYLTPDEHQQKVDEANKAMKESCD